MINPMLARLLASQELRNTKAVGDGTLDANSTDPNYVPSPEYQIKQEKDRRIQEALDNQAGYEYFL